MLNINYKGVVIQRVTERVQFGCLLDMAKYPKDKQNCNMNYIIGDPYSYRNPVNVTTVYATLARPPLFMKSTEFSVDNFHVSFTNPP